MSPFGGSCLVERHPTRPADLTNHETRPPWGRRSTRNVRQLGLAILVRGPEITKDVVALLRNPDQIALCLADPDPAAPAVDELLRYEPPVRFTHRVALGERERNGCRAGRHRPSRRRAAGRLRCWSRALARGFDPGPLHRYSGLLV
ncbi:hypothetical protein UK99_02645 [Frankia casuarinae]|nr:hypothetical protein UK99_02645 [Frankia casuarinae]